MAENHRKSNLTYCGAFCGACGWRLAGTTKDDRYLTEKAKALEPKELEYWLSCPGCKVGEHRADCDFRICAKSKDLERCVDCQEFPCQRHEDFNSDGVPHHANSLASLKVLKEQGEDAWLDMQEKRWTCSCGAKQSWYLQKCVNCGKEANPVRKQP